MTAATAYFQRAWVAVIVLVSGSAFASDRDDVITTQALALLTKKCVSCHGTDPKKGNLNLTSRETIVAGGDSGTAVNIERWEDSLLWQRVTQNEMPPKHPLDEEEKRQFSDWLKAGATWSGGPLDPLAVSTDHRAGLDWWSLQPLISVSIPRTASAVPLRQPIDDFAIERLSQHQLTMSLEADRRTLVRRAFFDLIGLPPLPNDVNQFVNDDRPDAFERLVDQLLASPHHGERWARHWLDVVRFAESNGFERDLPRPNAWHYRDWVIKAFNCDLPYDEFARWQIAADVLEPDNPEAIKAVGFLVAGAHDTVIPVVDSMRATMRQDELEEIVGTVGQTFLGLTANCARCHDHKFDPITTREYYQLASCLSGVDHGEREFISREVTQQLAAWQPRIEELTQCLSEQEKLPRQLILAERAVAAARPTFDIAATSPLAAWDFTRDLNDRIGNLHLKLVGPATRTTEGLLIDGKSFAKTAPLTRDLYEKTLEVRVRLKTPQQQGGGVMTVQTLSGETFDSIVYAELEPGRWMAGSENHARTESFKGNVEDQSDTLPLVITLVYRGDGTIVAYRNGQPYGQAIRRGDCVRFGAATTQVLFGMRHGTEVGDNRMFQGTIVSARLYDRALSAEDVAVSAVTTNTYVSEAEILSKLPAVERIQRVAQQIELDDLQRKHAGLKQTGSLHIYTAVATQPGVMKVHQRGNVMLLGDAVAPSGLAAIRGLKPDFGLRPDAVESHRRRHLANWLTDARNSLFARVMVNRVWHYHFGNGLVESPNDFGFHAGTPSHPELLEWLASEFQRQSATAGAATIHNAFSLKRLHRLLVTSATYRQSSTMHDSARRMDSTNRWLWRFSPRRLEAEEVRDAMLLIAGELNSQMGGKGYSDTNSYYFKGAQFYDPIDPVGFVNHRRTIYRNWSRGGRSPFLDNFDCPDPSTTAPRRSVTVTPLQALSLLNHSFVLRMADHLATRLVNDGASTPGAQVEAAYQRLYGRVPSSEETELGRDFIALRGLPAFCRALWNSSEFLFID